MPADRDADSTYCAVEVNPAAGGGRAIATATGCVVNLGGSSAVSQVLRRLHLPSVSVFDHLVLHAGIALLDRP